MESQSQNSEFMNNPENASTCIKFTLENGQCQFQRVYKIDILLRAVIKQSDFDCINQAFFL